MTRPYPHFIVQTQKLSPGMKHVAGTSAGKVAARGSNVCVENRIAAEYIFWSILLVTEVHKEKCKSQLITYRQSCNPHDQEYDPGDVERMHSVRRY